MPAETHVEQGPIDRQEVFELVRDRLADILEIEPSTINEGDSFADDLDADSLALIELVEALEEELGERTVGFRIDDEDLEDLKTVRDAVDYVVGRLGLIAPAPRRPVSPRSPSGSATRSPTRRCSRSRSRTGPGAPRTPATTSNERLEFLGDAVLGLVVTDHIFRAYPDMPEGELAKVRASVVSAAALAEVAAELDLGDGLLLGKGEDASGGRGEAVDPRRRARGGHRRRLPRRRLGRGRATSCSSCSATASTRPPRARAATTTRPGCRSWRPGTSTQLPRLRRPRRGPRPRQAVLRRRALGGERTGEGEGRSKKQAEQAAARPRGRRWRRTLDAADEAEPLGTPATEERADA